MNVRPISSNLLDPQTAAAHCGLLPSTYSRLTRANILPDLPTTDYLIRLSICSSAMVWVPTKKSEYKPLPYATVVWRKLSDDTYRPHAEWRHYPERKSIEHPFGSAAMFREWLALECDYAKRHPEAPPLQPRTPQAGPRPAPPTAKEIIENTRVPSPSLAPQAVVGKLSPQLRAPEIAARYGFTPRYWTKRAAAGNIPGARQPSGPGGGWLFDRDLFESWWRDLPRRESVSWRGYTGEERSGGAFSSAPDAATGAASRRRIEELLSGVLGNGSRSSKASRSAKPPRTFVEAAELFIKEHLTRTQALIRQSICAQPEIISRALRSMELGKVKRAELAEYEGWRRGQGVTAGTIRRDFACLSSLFRTAEDHEWIEDGGNPVPSFLRRRAKRGLKEAPPRTRYLSVDEERKLLEAATPAVRDAIALAIDTGLRREELFSLTWRQVDFARGIIATTTRTKSGRVRMVPLPNRSAEILASLPALLSGPMCSLIRTREPAMCK